MPRSATQSSSCACQFDRRQRLEAAGVVQLPAAMALDLAAGRLRQAVPAEEHALVECDGGLGHRERRRLLGERPVVLPLALQLTGGPAVAEIVLSVRGELVEVSVVETFADVKGRSWTYDLRPAGDGPDVRGDLSTSHRFRDGEVVTVRVTVLRN
jgi:hypothetical protein